MAPPASASGQPPASKEKDFLQKHGKRIVVILFSLLIGDALPVIIQNGLEPDKLFYTIVLVTLPYTGAMVLVFALWVCEEIDTFTDVCWHIAGSGLILVLFFGLGSALHWGISDAEAALVSSQLLSHGGGGRIGAIIIGFRNASVLISFYVTKYGLPMFISATLASFVIAWDIKKWMEK